MTPKLYYLPPSPPCRSVLLLGKMLGIQFNLKEVNIMDGAHLKQDFLQLNPTHTIPTLQMADSDIVLWESRVILTYLTCAYGKSDHEHLYPKDYSKRALVDLHLHFDLSTLYQRMLEYYFPTIVLGAPLDESKKARLAEALGFLETMLNGKQFSTGDSFTLADLTLAVTTSQIEAFEFDLRPYPKVRKWLEECKKELEPYGYQEINQIGADTLSGLFRSKLKP
ncbi:unnamed protein product [Diamesa serratosioi]